MGKNRKQARRQAQQKVRELDEMYRERMQRTQPEPTALNPDYVRWCEERGIDPHTNFERSTKDRTVLERPVVGVRSQTKKYEKRRAGKRQALN